MKLNKFHILDATFGAIDHSNSIACGNEGIGGILINLPNATGCNEGDTRENLYDFVGERVENINPEAGDAGSDARNKLPEMMLRDEVNDKMMSDKLNVFRCMDFPEE